MNTAIIVAAGSGSRFGGEIPKQFVEIAGAPVLIHTLAKFERCVTIDEIVVVVAPDRVAWFEAMLDGRVRRKPIRTVAGGPTRARSVFNGLGAVAEDCDVVAVHDGARPLVEPEEIDATVRAALEFGAACLAAPVTDTMKRVEDGRIAGTVDRTGLRRALTPQAFSAAILRRAFAASELGEDVTDECFLVETLGVEIRTVAGNPRNIKITTADDLFFAEHFLARSARSGTSDK
jgi:2-C-methyl-D-erythritol 4-phosphate cytidylyltransferase